MIKNLLIKKKKILFFLILILIFIILKITISHNEYLKLSNSSFDCLSAFDSEDSFKLINFKKNLNSHPDCDKTQEWILIDENGLVLFNQDYLTRFNIIISKCEYSTINWYKNDFNFNLSKSIEIKNGSYLDQREEFFYIKCISETNQKYETILAKIFKSNANLETKASKDAINVFILGFDSVSRENWLINLPKTSTFLLNVLKLDILKRYNIVGDGTPAALVPLLTGKHEHELPNTLKTYKTALAVNEAYPFIWNNFSTELKYSTLFGEDWPHIGTFHYRMKGFNKPPTDHYMRPFYLALSKLKLIKKHCINSKTNLKIYFEYIKSFFETYHANGFFGFLFLNEYSHDKESTLSLADQDLYEFLKYFYENKSLYESTVLVLMADHGPRFSQNRKSVKGLLKERNPFFSIFLPELFKKKYPNEFAMFKSNVNKLLTPMDIYRTVKDVIKLEKDGSIDLENDDRSLSMFREIKYDRTCQEAGISLHWCACLKRTELKIDNFLIKIANDFVEYINKNVLGNFSSKCEKLYLDKINRVDLLNTFVKEKSIEKKENEHGFKSLMFLKEPELKIDYVKYFFQVKSKPNNGLYEFTVTNEYDLKSSKNNIVLNYDSISRINAYGNSSYCIFDDFPDLRKYCFCIVNDKSQY